MKWFTIHGSLRDHRKWIGLPPIERGAWISLMTIAHSGEPRWRLGDRETVEKLLQREGFADPGGVLDRLIAARLVDETGEMLAMHDAADWQRKPSDAPDAVTTRVREHRRRKREAPDVTPGNAVQRERTPTDRQTGQTEEGSRAGARDEASKTESSRDEIVADLRKLWRRDPTASQLRLLEEIADRQRTAERSGWTWIAAAIAARPDDMDPVEFVKAEDRRLSDERLARADAAEAAWDATKRREREQTATTNGADERRTDAIAEAWHLFRDPATSEAARKVARKALLKAGEPVEQEASG